MLDELKKRFEEVDGKIREAVSEKKVVSDFYDLYENQMKSDYQVLLEQARAEIENIRREEERQKSERERGEVQQESKTQSRGKSGFSFDRLSVHNRLRFFRFPDSIVCQSAYYLHIRRTKFKTA